MYIMESLCSQHKSCRLHSYRHWRIFQMGSFIAGAMRCLPNFQRGLVIREIQRLQGGRHLKLCLQLMRMENHRLNKEFYSDPRNSHYYAPGSYENAVLTYIDSIPITDRESVLEALLDIIEDITNEEVLV